MYVVTLSVFHNLAIWLLYVNKPEPTVKISHYRNRMLAFFVRRVHIIIIINTLWWWNTYRKDFSVLGIRVYFVVEGIPRYSCWARILMVSVFALESRLYTELLKALSQILLLILNSFFAFVRDPSSLVPVHCSFCLRSFVMVSFYCQFFSAW